METDQYLSDIHINAAQSQLHSQFSNIKGLQCTLKQYSVPVEQAVEGMLQVLHINGNHWVAISTSNCKAAGTVQLYDFIYSTTLSKNTRKVIAQLLHLPSDIKFITVEIMNIAKQVGSRDCALFAIAVIVSLAHGDNPCKIKYDQDQMRYHLIKCFEANELTKFPQQKSRKYAKPIQTTVTIEIFCVCRLPDDGETMVNCEMCGEWFHEHCINEQKWSKPVKDIDWVCGICGPAALSKT